MNNEFQPECPAEYAEMKAGRNVRLKNGVRMNIAEGPKMVGPFWRVRTGDDKWRLCSALVLLPVNGELESLRARVADLESENRALRMDNSSLKQLFTAMREDIALWTKRFNRAIDLQNTAESKLAQIRALLDGVGPMVASIIDHVAGDQCGVAGEIQSLLSTVSETREVLKDEK